MLTPGGYSHWVGTLQIISLVFAAGTLRRASLGLISKNPIKKKTFPQMFIIAFTLTDLEKAQHPV